MSARRKRAVISVNIAVLFFGMAGLFAKWIHLPALSITFGRVLFSSITLGVYTLLTRQSFKIASRKDALLLITAGAILAVHWWAFLASIQLSSVAVGTITFSAFPLFVTFLEALVFRQKVQRRNLILAAVIMIGVFITVPEFSLENSTFVGILVGLFSSLTYAVLAVMNRIFVRRYSGSLTAFYEQATATVVLLPLILRTGFRPAGTDLALLLFLGIFTTALAHTLFISGLKELPAQMAGIFSSMETVYGIVLAWLLLGEVPTVRELIGAAIIIGAVITAQLRKD